jgi:hypothetical protein
MKAKSKFIVILSSIGAFLSILVWRIIANYPNIKDIASDINFQRCLQWLKHDIPVPHWLVLLLFLLLLTTICVVIYLVVKKVRAVNIEDNYVQDCFDKYSPIVFEWDYNRQTDESISDLKPLCPRDMTELKFGPHPHYHNDPSAPILYCRKCDFCFDVDPDHHIAGINYKDMIDYVVSQIDANIRNNSWRKASRRIKKAKKVALKL